MVECTCSFQLVNIDIFHAIIRAVQLVEVVGDGGVATDLSVRVGRSSVTLETAEQKSLAPHGRRLPIGQQSVRPRLPPVSSAATSDRSWRERSRAETELLGR